MNALSDNLNRVLALAGDNRHNEAMQELDAMTEVTPAELSALLIAACNSGSLELVQSLLSRGADSNFQDAMGSTPLSESIVSTTMRGRRRAIIETLLARGADPNAIGVGGNLPLCLAILQRCSIAIGPLIASGADLDKRTPDPDGGFSATELLTDARHARAKEYVEAALRIAQPPR